MTWFFKSFLFTYKGAAVTSWLLAGSSAFGVVEWNTRDPVFALVVGSISALISAIFVSLPKIISAKSNARSLIATNREIQTQNLITQMQQQHKSEVEAMRLRVAEQNRERTLMRVSKHNLLNELQRMVWHIQELEFQLLDNEISFKRFEMASIHSMLGNEDSEMQKLTANGG